jgi:RNA recognition motif-containing protein
MATRLFIGNLPYQMSSADLGQLFAQAGSVISADVVMDRMTGRSRGFGFVEMSTEEETRKAIEMLNGYEVEGRKLIVNQARPREEKQDRGERGPRRDFRRGR